jgi:SpoVK/Ycf46/Vps4 family AAA+-type ATPase
MELDHCVILFDEIDELIRLRTDDGTDPFGRFLTTSMLPKLAKLWAQRRVLFFVATNDIEAADPAIKRSQRFDAAVFVPPPSFEKKKQRLNELLEEGSAGLTSEGVEKALSGADPNRSYLGVFAFLRWDQIWDLAQRIAASEREGLTPSDAMKDALQRLGEELERTDWRQSGSAKSNATNEAPNKGPDGQSYPFQGMFDRWRAQTLNERRDYRAAAVLRLESKLFLTRPKIWKAYKSVDDYVQLDGEVDGALEMTGSGPLKLDGGEWKASDRRGIFFFK